MAQCAGTFKNVSLELGGNAPFIVFDDPDLEAAVAGTNVVEIPQRRPDVHLTDSGHVVDEALDGSSGLMMAREGRYDATVLDIMLPVIDGLSVARELRRTNIATPILM